MSKTRKRLACLLALMLALLSLPVLASADAAPGYAEAPMLAEQVASGALPPVAERLPKNPLVIPPIGETGSYGGVLHLYAPGPNAFDDMHWVREANWVRKDAHSYFDKGAHGIVSHRAEVTANDAMTEFVVKLREGVKWSDGQPCTADDILFAVNDVWLNEDLNTWWYGWNKDNRPAVTREDDYTVKFVFEKPATTFLNDLAGWGSNQGLGVGETPSHYLKQFHIKYNEKADEEAKAAGYDDWIAQYTAMADCGDGQINIDLPTINAWMLKSKTTTQRVYARNPYFWAVDDKGNQLPYIDGYVVDAVSDGEVAKLKLIAGEFDIAGVFLIQLQEYPMLKQNEQTGQYTILTAKGNATAKPMISLNMNHKDPVLRELFNTPDFRKALSYAIDRDEINQISFAGLAKPMQDVYTVFEHVDPAQWATMYTEFDQAKARELLDGLGLKKDEAGFYLRSDGQPLTINLQTIVEEGWGDTVELVAKHWSDVGVKTQYSPIDRTLFGERNTANELDVWIWQDGLTTERSAASSWGQWNFNEKAWDWYYWLDTNGTDERGVEPPAEVKAYYADVQALFASEYGSDAYKALVEKVWNYRVTEQLYCIGTVGDYPSPLLVKTALGNVGNTEVMFDYWQAQYPEQFYWKDEARRAEKLP